ncbi:MAG TPA: RidA family protein [Acidimicrobiaceae bacterium]|nr:RidA family protein [Acidimicrobiaceae bacterium]
MTRRSIDIVGFEHANPIPAATRVGPLVVCSITPPYDPGTRDCPESLGDQIANLFVHVGRMLDGAGAGWDDVAKMTFYVADAAAARAALNGPWVEHFPDAGSRPSRHNLEVLPAEGAVGIACDFVAWVRE